jgi:hypothetical protein
MWLRYATPYPVHPKWGLGRCGRICELTATANDKAVASMTTKGLREMAQRRNNALRVCDAYRAYRRATQMQK